MKSTTYSIQAGQFKAKCLQLMDDVNENHISIIITKHGKPIAKLMPIDESPIDFYGCMANTITFNSDIIEPIDTSWEADE